MNRNLTPETPFLKDLFICLLEEGVDYCILRDYENLPIDTSNHDIDMLVNGNKNDLENVFNIINIVAGRHNGKLITYYKNQTIIARFCGKEQSWWGVAIDIIPKLHYRSMIFYNDSLVLKNKEKRRGLYVASSQDNSMISFLKECIANGRDRKNYASNAINHYKQTPEYYADHFIDIFGQSGAKELKKYFTDNTYGSIALLGKKLKKYLFLTNCRNEGVIKTSYNRLKNHINSLPRILNPPGFTICVLGTDGSGKSTIIKKITPILEQALHSNIKYRHMRPNLLPTIARLLRKNDTKAESIVTDPHKAIPSSFFGSFLRLFYYSLDYIFGYFLLVHLTLAKGPCLWVFDRYYYDYQIDPRRGRVNLPQWIIQILGSFIPKPNLILCLITKPELIHARKPELALSEVIRQVGMLKQFCTKTNNTTLIDTGCTINDSVNKTLTAIISAMAARYEK